MFLVPIKLKTQLNLSPFELAHIFVPSFIILLSDLGFKAQEFLEENFILEPDESEASHSTPSHHQVALTTAAKFGTEGKLLKFF